MSTHADDELREIQSVMEAWSAAIAEATPRLLAGSSYRDARVADRAEEAAALLRAKAKDMDFSARAWRPIPGKERP